MKTFAPAPPVAGQAITFTLAVSNLGPDDATGVTVGDPLPPQLTGPVATPSRAVLDRDVDGDLCPRRDRLGGGRHGSVTGTIAAGTAGQFLDNTATVTADQPDPDTTNNSDRSTR